MLRYILLISLLFSVGFTSLLAEEKSYKDGFTVDAVLSADFIRNIDGGIEEDGTILGNFDLTIELDTQKAGLWDNGTFFAYFLGNLYTNEWMTSHVGDWQVSSSLEAVEAFRLYEFWYDHTFSDSLSLLVGMHDYNSEFIVLEYGLLFTHSSFGIQPDVAQVGPSIFPIASLATRVAVKPTQNSYVLAAVYDGVAGDPNYPKKTTIELNNSDGVFASLEAGLVSSEVYEADYYKLALGVWQHTAKVENFAGIVDDKNSGVYLIGEKTIFANSNGALGAFFQLGFADSGRNQVDRYWGVGLNYKGLLSGRSDDLLGLAVGSAINSNEYKDYELTKDNVVDSSETAIELTYEVELYSWLVVQPLIQHILNPSMDKTIDDSTIVGARISLVY
ncbi:carbohydrate porin [Candidatus Sulfurimonas baltica]|uniref:Carbohydrate porin n=1 Tax=Candidatus Sulfurimonas baltica TaxID=2740404 RepID=A0A7S7LW16_9BACT|nr:carbohydrate porin [Candidatus Sulfurimonas baltica]QOY52430.1 carbohydrate porin [Candidatus Sulfurimonas baltica]